jgi:hypothetical protein
MIPYLAMFSAAFLFREHFPLQRSRVFNAVHQ